MADALPTRLCSSGNDVMGSGTGGEEKIDESRKWCTKCGDKKVLDEFHTDKTHKDGYKNKCKECFAKQKSPKFWCVRGRHYRSRDEFNFKSKICDTCFKNEKTDYRLLYKPWGNTKNTGHYWSWRV